MRYLRPLVAAAGLIVTTSVAAQPQFTWTDLGAAGFFGEAFGGVNNRGQVVGTRRNAAGLERAFIWNDGASLDIEPPAGFQQTSSSRINDSGAISGTCVGNGVGAFVHDSAGTRLLPPTPGGFGAQGAGLDQAGRVFGYAEVPVGAPRACFWDESLHLLTDLRPNRGGYAIAGNRAGQIVGTASLNYGTQSAVVWNDGIPSVLGTLGFPYGWAEAINDAGQIVGWEGGPNGRRAFSYRDGVFAELPAPPGFVQAWSINLAGDVVGDFWPSEGLDQAVLWHGGQFNLLSDLVVSPPWHHLSTASCINDAGQIVASASFPGEESDHLVLLTPLPAPATVVILMLGAVAAGGRGRH